ncbi:hypothetical protein [Micromonospora sp. WMMD712]|nr:hypothetical protein [Micromonospora sp. WMMD712]WFE55478.1 hypothetical protein O7633_00745 [Micromonospora sp. WMMD712]
MIHAGQRTPGTGPPAAHAPDGGPAPVGGGTTKPTGPTQAILAAVDQR